MLHESCTKRGVTEKVWESGRWQYTTGYTHEMSEEQIEDELDHIFDELQYKGDEFPFERGWREDGRASKMILASARIITLRVAYTKTW